MATLSLEKEKGKMNLRLNIIKSHIKTHSLSLVEKSIWAINKNSGNPLPDKKRVKGRIKKGYGYLRKIRKKERNHGKIS